MSVMRIARVSLPALALVVAYVGGVAEAHAAWGGLSAENLVTSVAHTTFHHCVSDVSLFGGVFASPMAEGVSCQSSWLFDLGALGLFFTTVVVIMRMRLRAEENRLDLARRYVEQGIEPPGNLFPSAARSDLRRGVVLIFAGLGLLATAGGGGQLGPVGLIPGFIGLGYIVSYALSQRLGRKSKASNP